MDTHPPREEPVLSRPHGVQFGLDRLLLVVAAFAVCFAVARLLGATGVFVFLIVTATMAIVAVFGPATSVAELGLIGIALLLVFVFGLEDAVFNKGRPEAQFIAGAMVALGIGLSIARFRVPHQRVSAIAFFVAFSFYLLHIVGSILRLYNRSGLLWQLFRPEGLGWEIARTPITCSILASLSLCRWTHMPEWVRVDLSSVYLTFTLLFLFVINALDFAPVRLEEQITGAILTCFAIGYCAFRLRHGCRLSGGGFLFVFGLVMFSILKDLVRHYQIRS